ncbi:MAG: pilus assembly protein PilM [Thermodesulfobacteriota bacterium]
MPGKILGIDIDSDSITAVLVEGGLRGYTIAGCGRTAIKGEHGLDGGLSVLSEHMDLKADTAICSVPPEQISYRNIHMPFKDRKKIQQAIGYEVETMAPFPIETLIVDFTTADQADHSEVLTASIRRSLISNYLEQMQSHGVEPRLMDIKGVPMTLWLLKQDDMPDNGLLLDIGRTKNTLVLFLKKRISLIRAFPFSDDHIAETIANQRAEPLKESPLDKRLEDLFTSFSNDVQYTIHAFGGWRKAEIEPEKAFLTGEGSLCPGAESILERTLGMPVQRVNVARDADVGMNEDIRRVWDSATMDNALALALRDTKRGMGFNFRTGEFEVKKRYTGLRKLMRNAAVFSAIIISLLLADMGTEYYFLKKKYMMLDNQISEIFRRTLPDITRIVDPVQQLKAKINELKSSDLALPGIDRRERVLDLLRDLSLRIPESLDVKVLGMVVDPETIQIRGETDTFNTVDTIKKGLEPSPYFSEVTISSANLDRSGKRVQFEMSLKRK